MRAVIQRGRDACVSVDGEIIGRFSGRGLIVLLGVTHSDTVIQAEKMAKKIAELKITEQGHSAEEDRLPILVVSQFTLYGSTKKGRKPSWSHAAPGDVARPLYEHVISQLRERGLCVETGKFGAMMNLQLTNEGPFTLLVEC